MPQTANLSTLRHTYTHYHTLRLAFLAVLLLSLVLSTFAYPSPARADDDLSLSTDDGVRLELNRDGTVSELGIKGRTLREVAGGGGFSLRMVGGNPNLLSNAGFEAGPEGDGVPAGWNFTGDSGNRPTLDGAQAHTGRRSVRVSQRTNGDSGAVTTLVPVRPFKHYTLSVWFKSKDIQPTVPPTEASALRLTVDQVSRRKGVVDTVVASGYSDTAGWNRQFVGFRARHSATHVRITGGIVGGSGTGWIDDLYLAELFQETETPLRGTVDNGLAGDGKMAQHAEVPEHGLAFDATYSANPGYIRIDGAVSATVPDGDKAFQVKYTLPVNALGWEWGDYVRRSRTISDRRKYSFNTIKLQGNSRYPYSVLWDDSSLLAVGVPLSVPRIYRTEYDTDTGLTMAFDLGLSGQATRGGAARATFSIIIYTSNPAWGFRAATKKYYKLFPGYYVRRTDPAREGGWVAAAGLLGINETYRDFGLGLHMLPLGTDSTQSNSVAGADAVRWDNERGLYSAAYNHHWALFYPRRSANVLQPYDEVIAELKARAGSQPNTYADARLRDEARGALVSTTRDYNGRLIYEVYDPKSLAFYQNLDPHKSRSLNWERVVYMHQVLRSIDVARASGGQLDAIHLDSTSGARRWAAVDNYARAHWAVGDMPLTFSYNSGLPVERGIFAMYEHIRRLAKWLHDRGMILSANFNANEATTGGWFIADQIDYFGVESGLPEREKSARYVTVDSFTMLKRTMAWQRPLATIDSTMGDLGVPLREVEERIEQAVFYGVYSGPRGNVAESAAGALASWADSARQAIYARYTPTLRRLATAGWEPVTNAISSNPDVWVERFGYASRNNLYLTLRNETEAPQKYTLEVDLNRDGRKSVRNVRVVEQLSGASVPVTVDAAGTRATLSGDIAPNTTRVLRVFTAAPSEPRGPGGAGAVQGTWKRWLGIVAALDLTE